MLDCTKPERISCQVECQQDPFDLWVDPSPFIHIFRNIFPNAYQPMEGGRRRSGLLASDSSLFSNQEATMARILLIEDEQQVRELLREILEQNGHEIIACKNGADGIRQYRDC